MMKEVTKEHPSKASVYDMGEKIIIKYKWLNFAEILKDHASALDICSVCFPHAPVSGPCERWDSAVKDCCCNK